MEEEPVPKEVKLVEYAPSTFMQKQFQFKELPEKWQEFCEYLKERGDTFAAFFNTIPEVETDGADLILFTDSNFYKEWILEENNRKSLLNIISFYTEAPQGIRLQIKQMEKGRDRSEIKDKLQRRYENLME